MTMKLEELEQMARDVGRRIGSSLPQGVGFTLLLFDFGAGGNLTYISNARREDMIKELRDLVRMLEGKCQ